jgi:hypothetical protein
MAKKRWIKAATEGAHGQFSAKAKAAGETTRQFAAEHSGDSGTLGKQARLAQNLMKAAAHGRKSSADRARDRYKTKTGE